MNAFRLFIFVLLFISLPVSAASVSPGDLIISEVMANPKVVSDAEGEWFELHNLTGHSLDLNGLTISDTGTDKHTIGSLVIKPFDYLVLGNNGDSTTNGGYNADYVYSGFTLANIEDEIIISCAGVEIVRLEYSNSFVVAGKSRELAGPVTLPLDDSDYVVSATVYGAGDYGTPGYGVQSVPIPAAIWLFSSGLGLLGLRKKLCG